MSRFSYVDVRKITSRCMLVAVKNHERSVIQLCPFSIDILIYPISVYVICLARAYNANLKVEIMRFNVTIYVIRECVPIASILRGRCTHFSVFGAIDIESLQESLC